jgi:hypothetical protein
MRQLEFNFNKYLKNNPLLKEDEGSDMITIELDMAWDESDPEENDAANAAFNKFGIEVQKINDNPGTFEVSGRKEDILAYLKSEFYEMDDESIEQYYPELLDGEIEETSGYGNYTRPETMLEDDDVDYQSAEDFDLDTQDGENDPLGPDEELMEGSGKVTEVFNVMMDHMRSLIKKSGLDDDDVQELRVKLAEFFK